MQTTLQTVLVGLVVIEANGLDARRPADPAVRHGQQTLADDRGPVPGIERAIRGARHRRADRPRVLIFVSISAFKFLAAWWLWNGQLDGAVLQLILIGVSAHLLVRLRRPVRAGPGSSAGHPDRAGLAGPPLAGRDRPERTYPVAISSVGRSEPALYRGSDER